MFDETKPTSIHGEQERIEKPDFEDLFINCYREVSHSIRKTVHDNSNVLDIGCGKGSAEVKINIMKKGCVITCVDSDPVAIGRMQGLRERLAENGHGNALDIVHEDANTFLSETRLQNQDTVLMIAVLHEINNLPDNVNYLQDLLGKLSRITRPGSRVIIADYYYADSVTDEKVEEFKKYQLKAIGHADSREKFVKPEEIISAVERSKYRIVDHKTMQAVEGIERYFYIFTLERKAGDGK
jgi:SAM-dependent methyltransferase